MLTRPALEVYGGVLFEALDWPTGLVDRTVTARVLRDTRRAVGGHTGKRTRGEVVRHLLESGADARTPQDLAEALSDRWEVGVAAPPGAGKPWTVDVAVAQAASGALLPSRSSPDGL